MAVHYIRMMPEKTLATAGGAKATKRPESWGPAQDEQLRETHGRYEQIAALSNRWWIEERVLVARYHVVRGDEQPCPARGQMPSWEDCQAVGMTAPEAARARGTTRKAAYHWAKHSGRSFAPARGKTRW